MIGGTFTPRDTKIILEVTELNKCNCPTCITVRYMEKEGI